MSTGAPSSPHLTGLALALQTESEGHLRRVLDDLPVGVLLQGPRAEILFANRAAAELLGIPEDQILGRSSLDAGDRAIHEDGSPFPGSDHPGPQAIAMAKPVRDVVMGWSRPERRDRVWLVLNADPILDAQGRVRQVITTFSDITASRRADERLRESEARYRLLVENAQDIIYRTDLNGFFTYVNPVAPRIMGYSSDELLGKHFLELIREDHRTRVEAQLRRQFRARTEASYDEFVAIARDGREIWIGQNVQLMMDGRRVVGFQAVARDITDRKRAEAALAEASLLKSQFLANVSHELRTPLNGVMGMARLLLSTGLDSTQRDYVRIVEESGRDLLAMVNDILDFSKVEAGRLDLAKIDFNLADVLQQAVDGVAGAAAAKGLRIACLPDKSLPGRVQGDPARIRQITGHLLANAVKFTEEGAVVLRARLVQDAPEGALVRVEVTDTGMGIPAEAQTRLFQPFSQLDGTTSRRFGGAGLGLGLSKRLVEAMRGQIGVRSEPGKGSTFWYTVRLAPPSASLEAVTRTTPRRGRVLVVEDNKVNLRVASALLENLGYQVEMANNGVEAVEACARTAFDAVLMDCQMPEMDGFRATAFIREREKGEQRRTPIIALTASVLPGDKERCLDAGMDDYLGKPIQLEALDTALRRWIPLSERRASREEPAEESTLPSDHPLRLLQVQAGARVVAEVIDIFLQTTPRRMEELRQARRRGDTASVRAIAHNLKGAAAQIGARDMSELCVELQDVLRAHDLSGTDGLLDALQEDFDEVSGVLLEEKKRLVSAD
jgi:PAS domain S-box-containing protein